MNVTDIDKRLRLRRTAIKYAIIFGIGLCYLVFTLLTGLRIPCLVYELTGIKCPGCGVTRMIVSIVKFDFSSAFRYNPFLFITGPFILAYIFFSELKYVLTGDRLSRKWDAFMLVELALAIVYCILRNFLPI